MTALTADSSFLHRWVMAARPKTLPAAVAPVVVGAACAYHDAGVVRLLPSCAALLAALLLQIGSNFANDVFDFEHGADDERRVGPQRTVQAGLITPQAMKHAMLGVFALAFAIGLYLTTVGGPVVLVLGIAAILSAVAYTGGPYPLGYRGLGDVFVMLFFGFVAVCTTAFLNLGAVPRLAWGAALPMGALATNILVVNNVRDAENDARANKRTLVVRFGTRAGTTQYWSLMVLAYATPVVLLVLGWVGGWALLPLTSLPIAWRLARQLTTHVGSALNTTLADTAKLLALYGLLLAAGLIVDRGA